MSPMPAGWLPAAADLVAERPELAGVGVTDVLEAVTAA